MSPSQSTGPRGVNSLAAGSIDLFTEGSAGAISVSPQVTQPVFWNGAPVTVTPSLSESTVSVAPANILAGQTAVVTLTARDASGNQETVGGLNVIFALSAGSAGGSFGRVTDNDNGTYTATFTPSNPGTDIITATVGGQSVTSAAPTLTVTPTPTIIGLSPKSAVEGAGQFVLTVTGTYFASGYSVLWNGTALATKFVSATTLTATVPASDLTQAVAASIAIGYLGNTSPNPQSFTVIAQPEITGLSPASASAGGKPFVLTVSGANFLSGSTVLWNGAPLATVFVKASSLTATVPAALLAQASVASVAVENPGNVTSTAKFYTIVGSGPPKVTGITAGAQSASGLVSIVVLFNEPMNPASVVNPGAYTVLGAVKKKGRTVYTKALGYSVTYNSTAVTATIRLSGPYNGGVEVIAKSGLRGANGLGIATLTKPTVVS